jgi:hypothetical protein
MVEVVVCRYGEDLAWTRNLPRGIRLTIYDKSPEDQTLWPGSHPLANHSRDDFAWLHHLVERYDDLAELTVFAQGRPFDHAPDLHRIIRGYAQGEQDKKPDFAWLGFLWETDDARGRPSFVTWSKNPERRELNLEGFFQTLWGESAPEKVRYVGGSQFALSRSAAHRRSKDFYQKARDLSLIHI